jgi:hypothetical protein
MSDMLMFGLIALAAIAYFAVLSVNVIVAMFGFEFLLGKKCSLCGKALTHKNNCGGECIDCIREAKQDYVQR